MGAIMTKPVSGSYQELRIRSYVERMVIMDDLVRLLVASTGEEHRNVVEQLDKLLDETGKIFPKFCLRICAIGGTEFKRRIAALLRALAYHYLGKSEGDRSRRGSSGRVIGFHGLMELLVKRHPKGKLIGEILHWMKVEEACSVSPTFSRLHLSFAEFWVGEDYGSLDLHPTQTSVEMEPDYHWVIATIVKNECEGRHSRRVTDEDMTDEDIDKLAMHIANVMADEGNLTPTTMANVVKKVADDNKVEVEEVTVSDLFNWLFSNWLTSQGKT